jgi:hypothetical protein
MNAALLKKSSIREGTSFCCLVPISSSAHPNQLSAPSQFPFPAESSTAEPAQPFKWAALAHFPTPKGRSFAPPKIDPQTQVP